MEKESVRIEGYDQIANEALNEILGQLSSKHVYKVKIERTCKENAAGYVTPGEDSHTIHLCSDNIKKSFGKIHPANPEEKQRLKELMKSYIQKLLVEHEATHVKQLENTKPEDIERKRHIFEQQAERSEQKGRNEMEQEFGIQFKKVAVAIDEIANSLESKGLVKEAEELDVIANTLDAINLRIAGMGKKFTPVQLEKFNRILGTMDKNDVDKLYKSNKKWWDDYIRMSNEEDAMTLQDKSFAYTEEAFPLNILHKYKNLEDFIDGEVPDTHPMSVLKALEEFTKKQ